MVIYRLGLPYYKEFDNFQFAVLVSSRVWGRHAPTRSCPKGARIFKN